MISYTLTNPNPNVTPSSPATFPLRFRPLLRPYSGLRSRRHVSGFFKPRSLKSSARGYFAVTKDPPDIEIKGEVTRLEDGDAVTFEERTMKFSKSGEDFEVCFNKKSRVITKQTSKKLKIQDDIDVIIVEPVRDMFDASASTTDDTKDVWKTQDFQLGIPYCGMLSLAGIFSFMITGSICATKLNIILGGTFLALSIIGFRSVKEGNSSAIAVTGQAAIVAVLFVRQARVMFLLPFFFTETKIHQLYCNLPQWCRRGVLYQENFIPNGAEKRGTKYGFHNKQLTRIEDRIFEQSYVTYAHRCRERGELFRSTWICF